MPDEQQPPAPGPRPAPSLDAVASVPDRPEEAPVLRFDGPILTPPVAEPTPPVRERYPMEFQVAYQTRLSRLSTLLRLVLLAPTWFVMMLLYVATYGVLAIGWVAVLFRGTYPVWLFQGVTGALAWTARAQSYALLLTDKFPSLDATGSAVRLTYDQPERGSLSHWRVLIWKSILIGPHLFLLWFLGLAATVVTILAWFAILLTGRYPRGLFGFVSGVLRWNYRVIGYFLSLNDRYPPFALSADAGPASRGATVVGGLVGLLFAGGFAGIIIAAANAQSGYRDDVDYARLQRGNADVTRFFVGPREDPDFVVALLRANDSASELQRVLAVPASSRVVTFEFTYFNRGSGSRRVDAADFRLRYTFSEEGGEPSQRTRVGSIAQVAGTLTPAIVEGDSSATVRVVFTIPADATVERLTVEPPWTPSGTLKYDFR